MFEGLKFIPRDQIDKDDGSDDSKTDKKKSSRSEKKKKNKNNKKKSSSRYSSSDEELGKVKKSSRKKKWYSSDESESGESGSESEHSETRSSRRGKGKRDARKREKKRGQKDGCEIEKSDDDGERNSLLKEKETARKEMGLEWMLKPGEKMENRPVETEPVESKNEEPKANPRELNPYFKDNGSGYPEKEEKEEEGRGSKLLSSSIVGDGGASWRLKALKRAKEQAARDGREIESVVGERWGSLGQLAVSVSSHRAAPARAHLHAIHSRKRRDRSPEESQTAGSGSQPRKNSDKDNQSPPRRDYLKDVSVKVPKMREPKVQDSLSWGKQKSQPGSSSAHDAGLISDTVSRLNKFSGDGSFMEEVLKSQSGKARSTSPVWNSNQSEKPEASFSVDPSMSANQLAAKALQLRLKGKHEEAEKLMHEVEKIRSKQDTNANTVRPPRKVEGSNSRYVKPEMSLRKKRNEDDGDLNLAQKIMQNKKFSVSGQADDEYDYDGEAPTKKSTAAARKNSTNSTSNRFAPTNQRDCTLCYDDPKRPAHLLVSAGNFTYLMLPQSEPVVPGHCCILPMQHVQASRNVDEYAWEEIRNFKKCLIMMFAKQDKHVVFLETAMGFEKQRRHCMIECIPMPQEIAEEAPHYFKMEIEEAESEWSQHNAKKLIETGVKGLRKSIPENIPYFHVEFGLSKGFLHPIDDEGEFSNDFGMNIARGILKVPEEDMYRRRRRRFQSPEEQKLAVQSFAAQWASFNWTKQLDG